MKSVAIAYGLLGSIVPVLGAWLTLSDFATRGQWKFSHTVMLSVSSGLELLVLATFGALLLGKRRVALSAGIVALVFIVVTTLFFWHLSKGIAAGWH